MRWTRHTKLTCLGLMYRSPAAYRFVAQLFRLPSVRTLQRFIESFHVCTGFACDYFSALAKRAECLNEQERCVVVTFDSMSLRSSLKYLENDDTIVGFVDLDAFGSSKGEVAKNVLQFMVRGISSHWKQPVGHFFIGNAVCPSMLKAMLLKLIETLHGMNLTVIAVVCDQESSHRSCMSSLGVTPQQPYFTVDQCHRIYVMYDMPHLLKNMRNNLLQYDFIVDGRTQCHLITLLNCTDLRTEMHLEWSLN